ncbi:MAG: hypothetical protein WAZ30_15765 [Syntrophorhabdus sp.]
MSGLNGAAAVSHLTNQHVAPGFRVVARKEREESHTPIDRYDLTSLFGKSTLGEVCEECIPFSPALRRGKFKVDEPFYYYGLFREPLGQTFSMVSFGRV